MDEAKWYSCSLHIDRSGPTRICINDDLLKDAIAADPMNQIIDEFYAQLKADMIAHEEKQCQTKHKNSS